MTKSKQRLTVDKFYKTKKGVIGAIYNSQRSNSKKRKHPMPSYSLSAFREAVLTMALFHTLYQAWVDSDYLTDLKPSIDRDNDALPYTEDNITLMTWGENKSKNYNTRAKGRNSKTNKAVECFTLDEEYITTYFSITEASEQTGIQRQSIGCCCRLIYKSAGKLKWQYAT